MAKTKTIENVIVKNYFALVEIKQYYTKFVPIYLKPLLKNNHVVCETENIFFTYKYSNKKKLIQNYKPTNTTDYDHNKKKYWLKFLNCENNCEDHEAMSLFDHNWPDNEDNHFSEQLVRVYLKNLSGMKSLNIYRKIY